MRTQELKQQEKEANWLKMNDGKSEDEIVSAAKDRKL
jgi:hypothetical protein